MAVDWVKMRSDLYRDPKVSLMADHLMSDDSDLSQYVNQNRQCNMAVTRNVMRNAIVGALVSVWGVMRHRGKPEGEDLTVTHCTLFALDDVSDLQGFGTAMNAVGWVIERGKDLVFPRFFAQHNVDPASKNAERQRRYRERQRDVTTGVTRNASRNDRVEESRGREDKNPPTPQGGKARFDPTTIELPDTVERVDWVRWCVYRRDTKRKPITKQAADGQIKAIIESGATREEVRAAIDKGIRSDYQALPIEGTKGKDQGRLFPPTHQDDGKEVIL